MPFTPFHFGLGLAAKALVPRYFLLSLFVALQIVIDLESLYNLVKGRYPVHRFLHTFAGATLLALASAAALLPLVTRWSGRPASRAVARPTGYLFGLLLATALFATWSHVVLDAIMHRDARPLWPVTDANPLLSPRRAGALHLACLVLGFFGTIGLAFQWALREPDG